MTHQGSSILETDRLILRPFIMDDLEAIYNNCWSEEEVWKWTRYAPMETLDDVIDRAGMFTDQWLAAYGNPKRYSWAIVLKATGDVIGRFFGMNPDDMLKQVEVSYELGTFWWGQGLMTEALNRVIDFFFDDVGINRIYANHSTDNPASGHVMRKCGMQYEGTMRQAGLCNRGVYDMVHYAILAEDNIKKR